MVRVLDNEVVWRQEIPHVLAALLRRRADLADCEDAVQEALLAAAEQWSLDGRPDDPRAWLVRVASRRLIDAHRTASARTRREIAEFSRSPAGTEVVAALSHRDGGATDDSLQLLLLCAHPVLSVQSQVALTLRAVGGLSTRQIAAGFLVPEATMAQRISRAKATIREAGGRFTPPTPDDLEDRLHAVRHVLHLIFTEGHTSTGGPDLLDVDLALEAIRLTRQLVAAVPHDPETGGLLALMLLTHARAKARVDDRGRLVPLDRQDRTRWDPGLIAEGVTILERVLALGAVGPVQLQAAIAAVHAESAAAQDTDWLQICLLYRVLGRLDASPAVAVGLVVSIGMAHGPAAGLSAIAPLLGATAARRSHRVDAAYAHLLERAGDLPAARAAYLRAAAATRSLPEQRYLGDRAAACD